MTSSLAQDDYWYSWGSFHPKGQVPGRPDGFLASATASIGYARCLCESNRDSNNHHSARGTIFTYGVDGVCHQLSNQILWAATSSGSQTQTVHLARGYWLSNALFGTYGLQHAGWAAKKVSCMQQASTTHDPDDFAAHATQALRGHASDQLISEFLDYRQGFMLDIARLGSQRRLVTADELNAQYNSFFRKAAEMLGAENFERVFGTPPAADFSLIDPNIYADSQRHPT